MPQIASYGHSGGMLYRDPRLVEAKPATAHFVVAPSGKRLVGSTPTGTPPSLSNGDFATHTTGDRLAGWSVPGMLTQGGEGGRPAPLASRFHRVPTHFILNLHGV